MPSRAQKCAELSRIFCWWLVSTENNAEKLPPNFEKPHADKNISLSHLSRSFLFATPINTHSLPFQLPKQTPPASEFQNQRRKAQTFRQPNWPKCLKLVSLFLCFKHLSMEGVRVKEEESVTCIGGSSSSSSNFSPQPMEGLHEVGPPPFLTKTFEMGCTRYD